MCVCLGCVVVARGLRDLAGGRDVFQGTCLLRPFHICELFHLVFLHRELVKEMARVPL